MSNFTSDLNFGKKWELVAQSHLCPDEVVTEVAPNKSFKEWDFKTNQATYEVKSDRLAYKWGWKSMFIEYECNGKPSGIQSTKADFWYYFMVGHNEVRAWKIPIAKLKEAIPRYMRKVNGGDFGRSRGYILDVNEFAEYKFEVSTPTGALFIRLPPPRLDSPLDSPKVVS